MEVVIIVLPIILPMAATFIGKKVVETLKNKMKEEAEETILDIGRDTVNVITRKTLGLELFQRKITDLTVNELMALLDEQVFHFRDIVAEEVQTHLSEEDTQDLLSGVVVEINTLLGKVEASTDGLEDLLFQARQEFREQRDWMGNEWSTFSTDILMQIERLESEKASIIITTLKNDFSRIEEEIKALKVLMARQTQEIIITQDLITQRFNQLEQYLQMIGAIAIDPAMDMNVLQQKYQMVLSSVTCPKCNFTNPDPGIGEIWYCPECHASYTRFETGSLREKLSFPKLVALSIFNQAWTIKNSRGDIQFDSTAYIHRKNVENEFQEFDTEFEKGNPRAKLFLLLGEVGVGKTWAAAALAEKYSKRFPMFYFSLRESFFEELKNLFLDDPQKFGIKTVFQKIKDALEEDSELRLLFVFDGYDEIHDELKERLFIQDILRTLLRTDRIMVIITSRRHDWLENRIYKQEAGWLDTKTWHLPGIILTYYSQTEFQQVMQPLIRIASLEEWERHWGNDLRKPFLQAIVKRLALSTHEGTFITIQHPQLFEIMDKRLGIIDSDRPYLIQFAENHLTSARYLTRNSFEDQTAINHLLSAGLIKEKQEKAKGYNPFRELILGGPIQEAYCHYLRFWSLRIDDPVRANEEWITFQEHQKISSRVRDWVTLLVQSQPELRDITSDTLKHKIQAVKPTEEKVIFNGSSIVVKRNLFETIKDLLLIYKEPQVPVLKLSQKTNVPSTSVLESLEDLIIKRKINAVIDNRGTANPEDAFLILEPVWNPEITGWDTHKSKLDELESIWSAKYSELAELLTKEDLTSEDIKTISDKITSLIEAMKEWKKETDRINPEDFVSDLYKEVSQFFEHSNNKLNAETKSLDELIQQWNEKYSSFETSLVARYNGEREIIEDQLRNKDEITVKISEKLDSGIENQIELKQIQIYIENYQQILSYIEDAWQTIETLQTQSDSIVFKEIEPLKQVVEGSIKEAKRILPQAIGTVTKFQEQEGILKRSKSRYHDVELVKIEHLVLEELESIIGTPIPLLRELTWDSFGFTERKGHITGLSLCAQRIVKLPDSVGNLSYLVHLDLAKNELQTLPRSLQQLNSLEYVNLNNNKLGMLIEGINKWSNLKQLYLYENNLSSIPETLGSLQNLQMLNLNSNRLTTLPETLKDLKNLEVLDLYNNDLSSIPSSVTKLKKLKRVFLGKNPFVEVPEKIIKQLEKQGSMVFLK